MATVLREPQTPVGRLLGMGLTPPQANIFLYLFGETARNGFQPSVREVALAMGLASPNGVLCHLKPLATKGWIAPAASVGRAIRFLKRPDGGPFLGFAAKTDSDEDWTDDFLWELGPEPESGPPEDGIS